MVGFEEFNAYDGTNEGDGVSKTFAGLRLLADNQFSVTVKPEYANYYYAISYAGFSPFVKELWCGDYARSRPLHSRMSPRLPPSRAVCRRWMLDTAQELRLKGVREVGLSAMLGLGLRDPEAFSALARALFTCAAALRQSNINRTS